MLQLLTRTSHLNSCIRDSALNLGAIPFVLSMHQSNTQNHMAQENSRYKINYVKGYLMLEGYDLWERAEKFLKKDIRKRSIGIIIGTREDFQKCSIGRNDEIWTFLGMRNSQRVLKIMGLR